MIANSWPCWILFGIVVLIVLLIEIFQRLPEWRARWKATPATPEHRSTEENALIVDAMVRMGPNPTPKKIRDVVMAFAQVVARLPDLPPVFAERVWPFLPIYDVALLPYPKQHIHDALVLFIRSPISDICFHREEVYLAWRIASFLDDFKEIHPEDRPSIERFNSGPGLMELQKTPNDETLPPAVIAQRDRYREELFGLITRIRTYNPPLPPM